MQKFPIIVIIDQARIIYLYTYTPSGSINRLSDVFGKIPGGLWPDFPVPVRLRTDAAREGSKSGFTGIFCRKTGNRGGKVPQGKIAVTGEHYREMAR